MSIIGITPPGGPELIVVLVIVLLLFGAKKLPELGSSVGKSIKNFKKGVQEGKENVDVLPRDKVGEGSHETAQPR